MVPNCTAVILSVYVLVHCISKISTSIPIRQSWMKLYTTNNNPQTCLWGVFFGTTFSWKSGLNEKWSQWGLCIILSTWDIAAELSKVIIQRCEDQILFNLPVFESWQKSQTDILKLGQIKICSHSSDESATENLWDWATCMAYILRFACPEAFSAQELHEHQFLFC